MSDWLYPLTLPPLFIVHPDEKPVLRQPDSQREQEFKALPAWSEKVFEDWCHDQLGEDAGFGLIDIDKPDDWHLSVKNEELDEMIATAYSELKAVLIEEEKAAMRPFSLDDALGPLPDRGSGLGQMRLDIAQAIQEEVVDLSKAQMAPKLAQSVVDMGLNYFNVVNPIQNVMAVADDPENVKEWISLVKAGYDLYSSISGAAATGTTAAAGGGGAAAGGAGAAAGGLSFPAGAASGVALVAAVAVTIGIDIYSNRKAKKYAEHISHKIERIFKREVGEIQEVVTDAMDLLIETFDKMKVDIQEKVRLRKKEMNRAAAQAILTGHGVLQTKRFKRIEEEDVTETQEYEKVVNRRRAATVSAIAAIAMAQAIIRGAQ